MKLLILLLCFSLVFLDDLDHGDSVVELSDDSYEDFLSAKKFSFVKFYAPWCGHCKKLAPELKAAADKIASLSSFDNLQFGSMNCDDYPDFCQEKEVEGYPTLKVFKNGEFLVNYSGQRNANAIVKYMISLSGVTVHEISDIDSLKKLRSDFEDQSIVIMVSSKTKGTKYRQFEETSKSSTDVVFVHSDLSNPELLKYYKLDSPEENTVVVLPFFEDIFYNLGNKFKNSKELSNEITEKAFQSVQEVSEESYSRLTQLGLPLLVLFVDPLDFPVNEDLLKAVAARVKGKLTVCWSDADKYIMQYENIGGSVETLPGIGILATKNNRNYRYDGDLDTDEIVEWCEKFERGEIKPFLKSEEIPEVNDDYVYVLVGKNYNEIVVESERDVFVEFYAPWCGHCKALAPELDSLAESVEDLTDVLLIAKMDSTQNDPPDENVVVRGYPTMYFYPAGKKNKPIQFSGDRNEEGIKKFLMRHAKASKSALKELFGKKTEKKTAKVDTKTDTKVEKSEGIKEIVKSLKKELKEEIIEELKDYFKKQKIQTDEL